jgi:hypothetical protein
MTQPMRDAKKTGNRKARKVRGLTLAAAIVATASVAAAQAAPSKPLHAHKPPAAHTFSAVPAAPVDATPAQPEMPKWPVNDAPSAASVTWNSQGLHVHATNSSLSQILHEISTETGAKIEGLSGDERVFGDYGPGPADNVLSQLLHGSAYDFLLLGDQGQGTPREVILTAHKRGPARSANAGVNQPAPEVQPDEEGVAEPEVDEPVQPQPQFQPAPPPANPQEQMTPEQRMQLMQQQRLQQMQQMQQQYQQQQQQQQQQNPPESS